MEQWCTAASIARRRRGTREAVGVKGGGRVRCQRRLVYDTPTPCTRRFFFRL